MTTQAQKKAAEAKAAEEKIDGKIPGLEVATKIDGFRRGGRSWSGTTQVAVKDFTEEQIKQLEEESNLTITKIELDA